jgi:hypothetical protein
MFSSLVDLTSHSTDLSARLHPTKSQVFEWIISGQCTVESQGKTIAVVPDVQFHVNGPRGIVVRHFSEFVETHRKLRDCGESDDVQATITLTGFEPDAEPVLREMRDGSIMLVFAFIPPQVTERDSAKASQFDLNAFGAEIGKAAGVPVAWDDKEVFVIQRPKRNTVEKLRAFLQDYWKNA